MTQPYEQTIRLLEIPCTLLSVQPGDVIVARLQKDYHLDGEEAERVLAMIREAFPGHTILPLMGIEVSIVRPETRDESLTSAIDTFERGLYPFVRVQEKNRLEADVHYQAEPGYSWCGITDNVRPATPSPEGVTCWICRAFMSRDGII